MDDETQHEATQQEPAQTEPTAEQPAKRRWRDRALGFRGVIAVTVAGVILGGLGGTALGFALDDDGHPDVRFGTHFRGDDERPGPGGGFQPPGMPQPPEGTVPDEDTQPDSSGGTSGSTNS